MKKENKNTKKVTSTKPKGSSIEHIKQLNIRQENKLARINRNDVSWIYNVATSDT